MISKSKEKLKRKISWGKWGWENEEIWIFGKNNVRWTLTEEKKGWIQLKDLQRLTSSQIRPMGGQIKRKCRLDDQQDASVVLFLDKERIVTKVLVIIYLNFGIDIFNVSLVTKIPKVVFHSLVTRHENEELIS